MNGTILKSLSTVLAGCALTLVIAPSQVHAEQINQNPMASALRSNASATQKTLTLKQQYDYWKAATTKASRQRDYWYRQMLKIKKEGVTVVKERTLLATKLQEAVKALEIFRANIKISSQNTVNGNENLSDEEKRLATNVVRAQKDYANIVEKVKSLNTNFFTARKNFLKNKTQAAKNSNMWLKIKATYEKEQRIVSLRQTVVNAALSRVGAPYTYGGEGPWGFDCSGLTMWSYRQVGIDIPHYSGAQMVAPGAIPVPLDQMIPGDLMYFGAGGSRHAARRARSGARE